MLFDAETFGLFHVYFLVKEIIKEDCLDIHLVDFKI
ncbi:hypothetical protein PC129_g25052 [Phytophthora cactorum]|uniref:Uncharacterized protein n=1 Tax=Phytophthora cactorum TaxID=29920 RepID=A0A329RNL2_9STRA|nr:hypothetical protein PC129_g25052 [Phytophthora cactorum]KAG4224786.1 hypothetical protein PC116_g26769 [Phytophthora cactorum]RAW25266.1 hypothetical protein PC110_g18308 [Phytophthora cactorum]